MIKLKEFFFCLTLYLVLALLLITGALRKGHYVSSAMINEPFPDFAKYNLLDLTKIVSKKDLIGKVSLVVVWSSWCKECVSEFTFLAKLIDAKDFYFVGLNFRDDRGDAMAFLNENGNPFRINIFDPTGNLGRDICAYDVPEAYILDKDAIVRYKIVYPLTKDIFNEKVKPLINYLNED